MKTIGVREFLRGGYKTIDGPTLVMNHSRPIGVFQPYQHWLANDWARSPYHPVSSATSATFEIGTIDPTPFLGHEED